MLDEHSVHAAVKLPVRSKSGPLRLRRIIILETLIVTLAGFAVWGIAWDMGFPRAGLGVAIVVWLTVSPAIEIATVMKYRERQDRDRN